MIDSGLVISRARAALVNLASGAGLRGDAAAFVLMALCSRARTEAGLAPFAAAYFTSSLLGGASLPALLLGCALGSFVTGFQPSALYGLVGCAVAMALWLVWDVVSRRSRRVRLDKPTLAALIAGLAVMLPALTAAGYAPVKWLFALAISVTAALSAMALTADRRAPMSGSSMAIWACAGVMCVNALGLDPLPVAAYLAVLAGAAGRGAPAGCGLGLLCALLGGGAADLAALAAIGAASDAANKLKPGAVFRALFSSAVCAAMAVWPESDITPWALIGCAAQLATPPGLVSAVREALAPRAYRDQRVTEALRRRTAGELNALSEAFGALSETCGSSDPTFGEQQLLSRMRAALCAGCPDYAECWPGSGSRAVKLFCQLMTATLETGASPFEDGDIPPDILRLCRRGMTVPARLGNLLNEFAAQRHHRVRLIEARRLIAMQFGQAAELLSAMAARQKQPLIEREGAASRAREALSRAGLPVSDVIALYPNRLEITATLHTAWTETSLEAAAAVLTDKIGKGIAVDSVSGAEAVFARSGRMTALAAACTLSAEPDVKSGDNHLIYALDSGRLMAALSDGMGSGEAAAEESERVLKLLKALIVTGASRELAISTVNGVMLARGGEEQFATVDMLIIDLAEGRAEFTKLSACRSYIARNSKLIVVDGGKLPLGILDSVLPSVTEMKLRPGDVIFMTTDGVAEALPEEVMESLMLNSVSGTPEAIAETLINAAAARASKRRDDMTALCVKIDNGA